MPEKKGRGARPGMGPRSGVTAVSLDRDGVSALKDAALAAGPEHFYRDNLVRLAAHLLANQPGGQDGSGSTYHAFEMIAACAERAIAIADERRADVGEPPVTNFARELPDAVVRVPVWALVTIYNGWMRATRGDVADDGTSSPPLPPNEAFGFGRTGDRTVLWKQRKLALALDIAIAVAEVFSQEPKISERRAFNAVATRFGVSDSVALRAWKQHQELARTILVKAAERLSNSGSR